jgi:hypothetical protein
LKEVNPENQWFSVIHKTFIHKNQCMLYVMQLQENVIIKQVQSLMQLNWFKEDRSNKQRGRDLPLWCKESDPVM